MNLCVLDTQSPANVPALVPELERLGYHRYWATEHHSPTQSASPTIVAALAAGITGAIRAGTAGVLLRAASPLRVAEDFATLELFFPGRIDLGIAGALPSDQYGAELARDHTSATNEPYRTRVARLVAMVRDGALPCGHAPIGPQRDSRPELWLCGTSVGSAELAGSLGISFAFHHYLATRSQTVVAGIGEAYRSSFVSVDGSEARTVVAAYGHCADTEERAASEWKAHFGGDAPEPSFVGTPEQVAEQLATLAAGYGADELAIDCFAPTLESRIRALADIKAAVDGSTVRRDTTLAG